MPTATRMEELRHEIAAVADAVPSAKVLMQAVCRLLHERMLKYNWVGFYMLEPGAHPPVLVLDTFVGAAASSGKMIVVDDVSKDPRYLACSLETKSEIVVPVFANNQVVGELDIDSHFPAAFGADDQVFVQYCAELVGKKLEKSR
jgi:L-methionine (R)-S-oxide reductase